MSDRFKRWLVKKLFNLTGKLSKRYTIENVALPEELTLYQKYRYYFIIWLILLVFAANTVTNMKTYWDVVETKHINSMALTEYRAVHNQLSIVNQSLSTLSLLMLSETVDAKTLDNQLKVAKQITQADRKSVV